MSRKTYSIGELARLSGTPVRRIRFYSDQGLLPPGGRTRSNYRFYTNIDIARLDLIRALRSAGIELAVIAKVIALEMPLVDVLRTRLGVLEHEIHSGQRMATALRATLSLPHPTEADLERILEMIIASNTEMESKIGNFVDRICAGTVINEKNRRTLLSWYLCELPEIPSKDQLQAWQRIPGYLEDGQLVSAMNINLRSIYNEHIGLQEYYNKSCELMEPIDRYWSAGENSSAIYVVESVQRKLRYDAAVWVMHEEDVIREYFFVREHVSRGLDLRDLCALVRGEAKPSRSNQRPKEFWEWYHEVMVIIQNENKRI